MTIMNHISTAGLNGTLNTLLNCPVGLRFRELHEEAWPKFYAGRNKPILRQFTVELAVLKIAFRTYAMDWTAHCFYTITGELHVQVKGGSRDASTKGYFARYFQQLLSQEWS